MIFYLPSIIFLISGIPQTIKLYSTKSSKDISLTTYILTLTAVIILCVDAYIHNNPTLLLSNLTSLFFLTINTTLIIKYRF